MPVKSGKIVDRRRSVYAEPISTAAKLLYLYLSARANAESVCWPGRDTIAKDLSASVSTVGRALSELVKAKLIVVESNASKAGTNLYHIYSPDRRADEAGHADLPARPDDTTKGQADLREKSHRPFIAGHRDPQRKTPVEVVPEKRRGDGIVLTDDAFIASLKKNPAYIGIDIDRELGKLDAWLLTPRGRGKQKTRQRIVNWLNRADRPVKSITPPEGPSYFVVEAPR